MRGDPSDAKETPGSVIPKERVPDDASTPGGDGLKGVTARLARHGVQH